MPSAMSVQPNIFSFGLTRISQPTKRRITDIKIPIAILSASADILLFSGELPTDYPSALAGVGIYGAVYNYHAGKISVKINCKICKQRLYLKILYYILYNTGIIGL